MRLEQQIEDFMKLISSGDVEIYNEISLQLELGIFLRGHLPGSKIQFERNISHFDISATRPGKREIDIAITDRISREKQCAIELKYPRNGQYPERMFQCCEDISFLEQLVRGGFSTGYFLALADDPLYYSGRSDGIYSLFRDESPIFGTIVQPTGNKVKVVEIAGKYIAKWQAISELLKFCMIRIDGKSSNFVEG